MSVTTKTEWNSEDTVVIHVAGRLDAATSGEFERVLLPVAKSVAVKRIVLACSGLEYVASAGLRVLVKAVKATAPRRAEIYGAEVGESVGMVLKITGFHSFITVRATVEDCLHYSR